MALLGLGAGLSPFFFAYYDASAWVPIGLGLVAASAVAVVARPTRPSGPAALALGGLLGLGIWSLVSTAWAESVENAVVSGNRWLAYGALLLLMLVLLRSERRSAVLLGAAGLGVAAVAISVLARLLGGESRLALPRRPPELAAGLHQRRGVPVRDRLLAVLRRRRGAGGRWWRGRRPVWPR